VPSDKAAEAALAASVSEQGMKAQAALLPFALLAFGVSLPVFVWVAGHAANAEWMSAAFATFAVGWGAFYGVVNWLKTEAATDLRMRARVQILGGLVWAVAIAGLAAFAHYAGPVRETLLLLILGAAMVCVVLTATWLPSLLIVAPVAVAGPLIAFFVNPAADTAMARVALGAAALGLALALGVNRILRRQYALIAERERLLAERAEQAESARRFARVKSDLVDSLSDELRDGLTGVSHVLTTAARGRAAPTRQQIGVALDAVNELLAIVGAGPAVEAEQPARRLRILTVEPDPLAAATLRASLEQLGHQVVHTTQAARAVELARICDLDLAVCGDPAAIPGLRDLPGAAGATPIVAVIGSDADEAVSALASGADALLRRPIATTTTARAIGDALAASRGVANDRQVA
jgi:CheY-like chemotaxis protein